MTDDSVSEPGNQLSRAARLAPAFAALVLVLTLSASVARVSGPPPDPRAVMMVEEGQLAFARGDTNSAVDAFEAALALDPGYVDAFVALADATRAQGLAGKSIGYYRRVLDRDPANFVAIAGEGQALVAQGAMEQAGRNLARLEGLCGANCAETQALRVAIQQGLQARMAAGESENETTPN